jgi:hypothetical protein
LARTTTHTTDDDTPHTYLVRPDGHVALVIPRDADAGELRRYADRYALRFSAPVDC